MNNNIEPAYVTFEQAIALKEKGFDEECSHSYKEVEPIVLYQHQDKKYNNSFKKEWQNTVRKNSHMDNAVINRYSAPEQWQVVEWLRINHGIWVGLIADDDYTFKFEINTWSWYEPEKCHRLGHRVLGKSMWGTSSKPYDSPQKAYLSAFDYILNNLI